MKVINTADAAFDGETENDVPRAAAAKAPAAIGDAIILATGGDRMKLTLLEFVDPAQVGNPGIDRLLQSIGKDENQLKESYTRYVAVRLKMRNLGAADGTRGREGIVHTCTGGRVIDSAGREHRAAWASVAGCASVGPPMRGDPSKIGCYAFHLPADAVVARYRLAINDTGGDARDEVEWILTRTMPAKTRAAGPRPIDRLADGADAWNAWRRANPRLDINLAECDLRGRDLTGFNLSRINLRHTQLNGAVLSDAILAGAEATSAIFALVGLSCFVIVDVTQPKSVPQDRSL